MGLVERGEEILLAGLKKEAARAGSSLACPVTRIEIGARQSGMRNLAVVVFGGQIRPEPLWIMRLTHSGFSHWFVRPFSRLAIFPGEHHAVLPVATPASASLGRRPLFGRHPWSSASGDLARRLSADRALARASRHGNWVAPVLNGCMSFANPLQFRSLGSGATHVAMHGPTNKAGFAAFIAICQGLIPLLDHENHPRTDFETVFAFSSLVFELDISARERACVSTRV